MGIDVTELSNTPILAPGFGTQGANLLDARSLFGALSDVVLFNVSRSIAGESAQGVSDRVKRAKAELEIGLSK
jgi:orotidine-5'-phosphate decarboxylase